MQLEAKIIDKKNLTPTEAKVLVELCCAKQTKSISAALGISIKVVERHIDHIYEKLGVQWTSVNKRSAAILIAIQTGMVKTFLRSVVAVLVLQSALLTDEDVMRVRVKSPRVVRLRSEVV